MIDLHVHSTASDGSCSPARLVSLAKMTGLSAIAITDHDTVCGCEEAERAGEKLGVEVVPGIEISTKYGGPIHILGYYVDIKSDKLRPVLDWVVHDRDERNRKLAEMMAADGLPVSYDNMKRRFGEVIGRPHFAQILVELGLAENIQDAFARYVEKGQKYWLPRHFLTIERSVEIIREAGGVPVLAHPFQYKRDDAGLRDIIEHCMDYGLAGMECRYSGYGEEKVRYLEALAEEYGLVKTGGSDFHGKSKPHIALGRGWGKLSVPEEFLDELKACKARM
ncbi:MAG: PHP domain-containing protein [Candidatus Limivicinus sp.]|jgi:predicted metal-dependent phosphoesterase TrpH